MSEVTLTPPHYRCRTHDRDLTTAVRAKVTADPSLVTNLGWRPTPGGAARVGTFRVDVGCPGDQSGSGGHVLRFRGSAARAPSVGGWTARLRRPGAADLTSVAGEPAHGSAPPGSAPTSPAPPAGGSSDSAAASDPAALAGSSTESAPVSSAGPPAAIPTGPAARARPSTESAPADVAHGEEVEADDFWVAARAELRPEKSLARVGASAKYVVSTVTVVGLVLTALGLAGTGSLAGRPLARTFAGIATAIALVAVLLALSYLAVRPEQLNTEDLDEIEPWYRRQFKRVWLVACASWLLLAAVLVAAGVAGSVLLTQARGDRPVLTLSVQGTGAQRTLGVAVQAGSLHPGDDIQVTVRAGQEVLLSGRATADPLGKASLTASVPAVPAAASYSLSVLVSGKETIVTVP